MNIDETYGVTNQIATDLNTFTANQTVAFNESTLNRPPNFHYGTATILGSVGWNIGTQIAISTSGKLAIRHVVFEDQSFGDWIHEATATPPQEYDLPLAEGIIELYPSVYRKDQFKNILIKLAARINSASKKYINVATLPEGYRPPFDTQVPATIKSVATGAYTASTAKIVQGAINVDFPDTGDFEFYINCAL